MSAPAIVSRIDGLGTSGCIEASRPFEKYYPAPDRGPFQPEPFKPALAPSETAIAG